MKYVLGLEGNAAYIRVLEALSRLVEFRTTSLCFYSFTFEMMLPVSNRKPIWLPMKLGFQHP